MEHDLINALIKLLSKAGGGTFVKDMIQEIDENGNPKKWTASEIRRATEFITWQTENFGTSEAVAIIETLLKKYNLDPERFLTHNQVKP